MTTSERGHLITIDGPNGSGKSTLALTLAALLKASGISILTTKEPTNSPLGEFLRSGEQILRGKALACLAAADRHFHIETEVLPAMRHGVTVISDRYIESSLALQGLDGVPYDFTWELNSGIPRPDLSIFLSTPSALLDERMRGRARRSRLEEEYTRAQEAEQYTLAEAYVRAKGYSTIVLRTNEGTPESLSRELEERIRIALCSEQMLPHSREIAALSK